MDADYPKMHLTKDSILGMGKLIQDKDCSQVKERLEKKVEKVGMIEGGKKKDRKKKRKRVKEDEL